MSADDAAAVEAHYDRYPYPGTTAVVVPDDPDHALGTLSYLLRRRPETALPRDARIWIAGCGTLQGARWGRMLPDAEILATDVSERTLERAAEVAAAVGADGVRFERGDLLAARGGDPFDLVVCTGVVHHLEDPVAGLAAVRARLAPDGAALVMVYHRAHRAALDGVRSAARRLAGATDDPLALACQLLEASLDPRCRPIDREMGEALLALRERDPAFLADLLLNPREVSYDVAEALALLERAGLRFASWQYPGAHRLRTYCDDPALLAAAAALDPLEEAALVAEVAGLGAPMLQLLARRDDAPAPPPYSREERRAMPMRALRATLELDVVDGVARPPRRVPSWRREGDAIVGDAASGPGAGRRWAAPAAALPALEACDGTRTVAELCEAFSPDDPDALLGMIDALGPDDAGLLAPSWA